MGAEVIGRARRIPALGPRGEGWVLVQAALLAGVVVTGLAGARLPKNLQAAAAVIAVVSGCAGLLLAASAVATLGKSGSPFPRPPAASQLKESGVFALVRHPIYGGVLLLSLAWSLARVPGRSSRPARSPSPCCSSHASRSNGSSIATPPTRAIDGACVVASSPTSGEEAVAARAVPALLNGHPARRGAAAAPVQPGPPAAARWRAGRRW